MNEKSLPETGEHPLSTRACLLVWAGLLLLTAITVGAAEVDFGFLHVLVAMVVASCKACLVVLWFMHLKNEGRGLRLMVLVTFVLLAIFIGCTFFDTAYR